jgi:hypothetical protein
MLFLGQNDNGRGWPPAFVFPGGKQCGFICISFGPEIALIAPLQYLSMDSQLLIKKTKYGFVAFVGYMLSPLSPWNDLFVNIPIAYVMASPVLILGDRFFMPTFIGMYWLSNVVGLVMLHRGVQNTLSGKTEPIRINRKQILTYLAISMVYTLIIAILVWFGYLRPPTEYF